jgi:hypothetical protein
MKVGGHNIMNQLASQQVVVNICWRMEARSSSSGGCGSARGGIHEHGEWEAASGGQTKVLKLVRG